MFGRKRVLSVRRLLALIISICALAYFWSRSRWNESTDVEEEVSESMTRRIQELEKARKDEEDFQRDFQRSLNPNDSTELIMGPNRYKLVKRPRLHYKKAFSYCKRLGGRLAMIPQAENTRKLQQLIGKADKGRDPYGYGYPDRRNAAWVGREKPKKKKKKKKGEEGEEDYMGHMMDPMMGGRGQEEQCPAISPNSLYVPAPCTSSLPMLCQFEKNAKLLPVPDDPEFRSRRSPYGSEDMDDMHDEM